MNVAPVAYRYARSLMQLSVDQGNLAAAEQDMRLLADTCKANPDLVLLLKSPVVKADKKAAVLAKVFAGNVGEVTHRFMGIMVRKGREAMLPQVAQAFVEIYRENQNIVLAEVRSAVPLTDAVRKQVTELAQKNHPGKSIVLSEKVDPTLIGGLIVRVGDEQYDGSVSRRLGDLRRKFSENPYRPEL